MSGDGLTALDNMGRKPTQRQADTPAPQHGKRRVKHDEGGREPELNAVKNGDFEAPDVVESVLALDPDQVALNPRNHRHQLKDPAVLAASILKTGQLEPIKVVTVGAYLRLFPDDVTRVGTCKWVSAVGSQRTQAAQSTPEIPHILAIIDDTLASSKLRFIHANFRENRDRDEPSLMDEAKAFAAMRAEYGRGGQKEIAQEYRVTEAYVSQRIALTKLIPVLQDLIDSPDQPQRFPVESARKVAKLDPDLQREVAEAVLALPVEDQFKAWKRWGRKGLNAIAEPLKEPQAGESEEGTVDEQDEQAQVPQARPSDETYVPTLNGVKNSINGAANLLHLALPVVEPEPLASLIAEDRDAASEAWKESLMRWDAYRANVEAAFELNGVKN